MNYYSFDEIEIGMQESFSVLISREMMDGFMSLTGDVNPLHSNLEYAKESGYETNVVYGMLTASFLSTVAGVYLPGEKSLIHSIEEIKFLKPVFCGETIKIVAEVKEKMDSFKCIKLKVTMFSEAGKKVLTAKMNVIVREE